MDPSYWHKKWGAQDIGFHQPDGNPLLAAHLPDLDLSPGARIFLPLCGKTGDIAWLLSQGFRVVGAELSQEAIDQLFEELGTTPKITKVGRLFHYEAPNLDIFVGDIFHITPTILGQVDATYDRAALVALPEDMRLRYVPHMIEITRAAPQLLITFDYDQDTMSGPPFSVPEPWVRATYERTYKITQRAQVGLRLKGRTDAQELVFHLSA